MKSGRDVTCAYFEQVAVVGADEGGGVAALQGVGDGDGGGASAREGGGRSSFDLETLALTVHRVVIIAPTIVVGDASRLQKMTDVFNF